MRSRRQLSRQIVLAVFVGIFVFLMCFVQAWRVLRRTESASSEQYYTRQMLERINREINDYKRQNGTLPISLKGFGDYKVEENGGSFLQGAGKIVQEKDGQLYDGWRQPFEYSIRGDNYLLVSYGADGKPGGVGADCDLSNLQPNPPESQISLWQFLSWSVGRNIFYASLIGGFVATSILVSGAVSQAQRNKKARLIESFFAVLFVVAFTGFTTSVIVALDLVPSGH